MPRYVIDIAQQYKYMNKDNKNTTTKKSTY